MQHSLMCQYVAKPGQEGINELMKDSKCSSQMFSAINSSSILDGYVTYDGLNNIQINALGQLEILTP